MKNYILSWLLLAVLVILSACTSAKPTCQPSKIQSSPDAFPEIQGTMDSEGELWALLFFDKAQAGKDLKIVWRITGEGEQFSIQAKHEDGTTVSPIWGPEYHGDSSWHRPGEEWGTGFNFPKPGCWMLTATRGSTIGHISLDIAAP
jgi:hypothetical protein